MRRWFLFCQLQNTYWPGMDLQLDCWAKQNMCFWFWTHLSLSLGLSVINHKIKYYVFCVEDQVSINICVTWPLVQIFIAHFSVSPFERAFSFWQMFPVPVHVSVRKKQTKHCYYSLCWKRWEELNERNGSLKLKIHLVCVVCVLNMCFHPCYQ